MTQWTLVVASSPANGGTVSASSYGGTIPDYTLPSVTVTASPKADCNWHFEHWNITASQQGVVDYSYQSFDNPLTSFHNRVVRNTNPATINVTAVFSFRGTGKIMRSSVDPSRLIGVSHTLLIDS